MHPNPSTQARQRRVRHHARNSDSYAFFNLLTGPELFDQVESLLPAHRERLFPPTETLSMFLAQALSADRSCQNAVNEAAVKRWAAGLAPCSTHTGAYCHARQRLPVEMVSTLARYTGRWVAARAPESWHWRGLIAQQRVGERPGRIEPRAVKRRPKPYPLLTTARVVATAHVRKHGHPKKLK